jgi:hypothetical protein
VDLIAARAHLAASIYVQMALKPHIIHVVGHSEAHHAANADDVIEACLLARRAIENALRGAPDMTADSAVKQQVEHLVAEAHLTLQAIRKLGALSSLDPWSDPVTLAQSVKLGILTPPVEQLAQGQTRMINGSCIATHPDGTPLNEGDRLKQYLS